ncbi:GNAT family N-acetyltransferase [Actibacterium sp. 188UL27-1]|uniref:GNAT family N-acetyltransferase n=1 Tax=Actibacterium sp. 188UL27-1 TaxID=2786961 RepID=UPI00195E7F63|nr:GNAT family N-acetyltransferase [Actibacterium sp. 188UL27-1]MBM7067610.1 GNAT family N-acetyltransferase [Actibacterium sp. 188UL27-1]
MPDPVIKTDRLTLRPPRFDDAPAIAREVGDFEIARWLTRVPHPYSLEDAHEFLDVVKDRAGSQWVIEDANGLRGFIGTEGELGYWLSRNCWGQGYLTEAARAVVADWFFVPTAPALLSGHFDANARSANVLKKLGFGYCGQEMVSSKAHDDEVLLHRMVLTPEQYHAMHPWRIQTDRLCLRPLTARDAERLTTLAGVPEVARNLLSVPTPWSKEQARHWIEASRWKGRNGFRLGITRSDGTLIGFLGLVPHREPGTATTMYALGADHWGQGFATEAMAAFLPAAMARFGLSEVRADHFTDNPGSGHVLRKLGFERCGEETGRSAARVEEAPLILYRLRLNR